MEGRAKDRGAASRPTPGAPLPVVGGTQRERSDAARNRARVLAAAGQLFARRGVENVSMEEIARAAGVGKGTVYRRFGDRASLANAILDARERALQDDFLRGPPPLGPGAPPRERLKAFGSATLNLLEQNGELMLAAQSGAACARMLTGAHLANRAHIEILIRDADPEVDFHYLADVLLEALSAEFFRYLRHVREMPLERIEAAFFDLVDRLLPQQRRESSADGSR